MYGGMASGNNPDMTFQGYSNSGNAAFPNNGMGAPNTNAYPTNALPNSFAGFPSSSTTSSVSGSSTPPSSNVPFANLDKNTLWMGDLDAWMDENYVRQIWQQYGEQVNVKVIRDKFTGFVNIFLIVVLVY
jgi:hypothetical protein